MVDRFILIVSKDVSNIINRMGNLYSAHCVGQIGDQMDLINWMRTRKDLENRKRKWICKIIALRQLANWSVEQQKVQRDCHKMIGHSNAHAVNDTLLMKQNTNVWFVQISRSASFASTLNFTKTTSFYCDKVQTKNGNLLQEMILENKMTNTKSWWRSFNNVSLVQKITIYSWN